MSTEAAVKAAEAPPLEPEFVMAVACEIVANRLHAGESLTDAIGGVVISGEGFQYFYYLQALINLCLAV